MEKNGSSSCTKKANSRCRVAYLRRRSASSVQLIREGISFSFSFSLRTRKLKRGNSVNGIETGARCIAVLLPPSPFSPFFSFSSSHVRAPRKMYVHAHARGAGRSNTIGRRARARTCHASFLTQPLSSRFSKEHTFATGRKFFCATRNSREGLKSGGNAIQGG